MWQRFFWSIPINEPEHILFYEGLSLLFGRIPYIYTCFFSMTAHRSKLEKTYKFESAFFQASSLTAQILKVNKLSALLALEWPYMMLTGGWWLLVSHWEVGNMGQPGNPWWCFRRDTCFHHVCFSLFFWQSLLIIIANAILTLFKRQAFFRGQNHTAWTVAISFLSKLRLLDVQHTDKTQGLKTDYCNIGKMHSSHPPLFKKMTNILPDTHVWCITYVYPLNYLNVGK